MEMGLVVFCDDFSLYFFIVILRPIGVLEKAWFKVYAGISYRRVFFVQTDGRLASRFFSHRRKEL